MCGGFASSKWNGGGEKAQDVTKRPSLVAVAVSLNVRLLFGSPSIHPSRYGASSPAAARCSDNAAAAPCCTPPPIAALRLLSCTYTRCAMLTAAKLTRRPRWLLRRKRCQRRHLQRMRATSGRAVATRLLPMALEHTSPREPCCDARERTAARVSLLIFQSRRFRLSRCAGRSSMWLRAAQVRHDRLERAPPARRWTGSICGCIISLATLTLSLATRLLSSSSPPPLLSLVCMQSPLHPLPSYIYRPLRPSPSHQPSGAPSAGSSPRPAASLRSQRCASPPPSSPLMTN